MECKSHPSFCKPSPGGAKSNLLPWDTTDLRCCLHKQHFQLTAKSENSREGEEMHCNCLWLFCLKVMRGNISICGARNKLSSWFKTIPMNSGIYGTMVFASWTNESCSKSILVIGFPRHLQLGFLCPSYLHQTITGQPTNYNWAINPIL